MHCCVFMGEKKIWIQLDYEKFPPREKSSWFTEYRQMFHFLKVICPNFVQTGIPPEVYDEINKIRNKLKCLGDYRSCTISGRTSVVLQLVSNLYFLSIDKKWSLSYIKTLYDLRPDVEEIVNKFERHAFFFCEISLNFS